MCFTGGAGRLKNIAFIVLQRFQPRRNIAFVLDLSTHAQVSHQKCAAQLSDQFFKRIAL